MTEIKNQHNTHSSTAMAAANVVESMKKERIYTFRHCRHMMVLPNTLTKEELIHKFMESQLSTGYCVTMLKYEKVKDHSMTSIKVYEYDYVGGYVAYVGKKKAREMQPMVEKINTDIIKIET